MKRVLIITYYWPPGGGSGVQRWLKFSKYLSAHGWQPVIFTPENPAYDLHDPELEKEVPQDVEVIRFPIREPLHLVQKLKGKSKSHNYQQKILEKKQHGLFEKVALWVRANFFIPDPRITWVKPATKFLLNSVLEQRGIDAVITTGPPFSLHLIGQNIRQKSNIPWIADFRDPWSDWDILRELNIKGRAMEKHKALEKSVLQSADEVLTSSPATSALLNEKVPRTYHNITNGADLDDFESYRHLKPAQFRLTYAGRLYPLRNPDYFWKALSELVKTHPDFARDLEIFLAGEISADVKEHLNKYPELQRFVFYLPYQSHRDIIQLYFESAVLLLFQNKSDNNRLIIPGKLFEYLAAERRVIMTGPADTPAAEILYHYKAGEVFSEDDSEALKQELLNSWKAFKSGNYKHSVDTAAFNRKKLTAELARILDQLSIGTSDPEQ